MKAPSGIQAALSSCVVIRIVLCRANGYVPGKRLAVADGERGIGLATKEHKEHERWLIVADSGSCDEVIRSVFSLLPLLWSLCSFAANPSRYTVKTHDCYTLRKSPAQALLQNTIRFIHAAATTPPSALVADYPRRSRGWRAASPGACGPHPPDNRGRCLVARRQGRHQ